MTFIKGIDPDEDAYLMRQEQERIELEAAALDASVLGPCSVECCDQQAVTHTHLSLDAAPSQPSVPQHQHGIGVYANEYLSCPRCQPGEYHTDTGLHVAQPSAPPDEAYHKGWTAGYYRGQRDARQPSAPQALDVERLAEAIWTASDRHDDHPWVDVNEEERGQMMQWADDIRVAYALAVPPAIGGGAMTCQYIFKGTTNPCHATPEHPVHIYGRWGGPEEYHAYTEAQPSAPQALDRDELVKIVGTALYGWGPTEPNEATGLTARIESEQVADAIYAGRSRLPSEEDPE